MVGPGMVQELSVGLMDTDRGFVQVMIRRLQDAAISYRVLDGPAPPESVASMRLDVLVVDPALLGTAAGPFLNRLAAAAPGMGIIICTGTSSVGQRVRAL